MSNLVPVLNKHWPLGVSKGSMRTLSGRLFYTFQKGSINIGLLLLRAGVGLLMVPHGWSKLQQFDEKAEGFYSFLNLGGEISLVLIIFAEFFCSLLLILGLGTRLALIPLIISMIVVVFIVKAGDPIGERESGLLYLLPYVFLFITGAGKYSLDYLIFGRKLEADVRS